MSDIQKAELIFTEVCMYGDCRQVGYGRHIGTVIEV